MEVGHIVRFASQKHPFLVKTSPCLDLDCSCSIMGLTLMEIAPSGARSCDQLTFSLRVCLKTWTEHEPPPRSLEVESLAHEFMARFPTERIQELGDEFQRARAIKRRLQSFSLTGSPDELVTYAEVIHEGGGLREGRSDQNFFFVFERREFLVEDHYCANPRCDCQEVHVEFWERVPEFFPKRRIKISQCLMARFSLEGKLNEIDFSQETASTTEHLLQAWRRRCAYQLVEFRRRYEVLKAIGAKSFPVEPKASARIDIQPQPSAKNDGPQLSSQQQVRRNAPCPCGSGLKFKRCCGRRNAVSV